MNARVIKAGATFFGVGYLPRCPGTWASAAGVGLYFFLRNTPPFFYLVSLVILIGIGFLTCWRAEEIFRKKDSHYIVIDEVAAMVAVLFFVPQNIFSIGASFVLFRIIDIVKPYPIKKIEQFHGSWGIMIDDIVAGMYTVIIVRLVSMAIRR